MFSFIKFVIGSLGVVLLKACGLAAGGVLVIAVANGTVGMLAHPSTATVFAVLAAVTMAITVAIAVANFVLWIRRSSRVTREWENALSNAYTHPKAYRVRERLVAAHCALNKCMDEQAGWAVSDRATIGVVQASYARDLQVALAFIDKAK